MIIGIIIGCVVFGMAMAVIIAFVTALKIGKSKVRAEEIIKQGEFQNIEEVNQILKLLNISKDKESTRLRITSYPRIVFFKKRAKCVTIIC